MLNKIIICGRLTAVPTLQVKNNRDEEIKFIRFRIACQRDYKIEENNYPADFIDCVAWRSTAQFIQAHFEKGQDIILIGRVESNNYKDKNGSDRKSTYINVERVYFAGKRKTANSSDEIPVPDDEYAPPLEGYIEYDLC